MLGRRVQMGTLDFENIVVEIFDNKLKFDFPPEFERKLLENCTRSSSQNIARPIANGGLL